MTNISTILEPGSPEWLANRRTYLGGTDAAGITGKNKFKTAYQVWEEKMGLAAPQPDNEAMLWGRLQEPIIRQQYADRTRREVKMFTDVIRDEQYPFIGANIDGFIDNGSDKRLLEIKTARTSEGWGELASDEVPDGYVVQIQHYLRIMKMPVADLAVLIGGSDFRIYTIEADHHLQEMLLEEEIAFWETVKNATPPTAKTSADCARKFRNVTGKEIVTTAEMTRSVEQLKEIRANIKNLEGHKEELEVHIKNFMGTFDTLVDESGNTLCTWKQQAGSKRIDGDLLRKDYPDIAAAVTKQGDAQRHFLVK